MGKATGVWQLALFHRCHRQWKSMLILVDEHAFPLTGFVGMPAFATKLSAGIWQAYLEMLILVLYILSAKFWGEQPGGGGGGGLPHFFLIRRVGPSIYCSLPKFEISGILDFLDLNFNSPQNIPTPKYSPILQWPPKYPQNHHTPKIFIFSKSRKNIEIKYLLTQKVARAYIFFMKVSEYPPLPGGNNTGT